MTSKSELKRHVALGKPGARAEQLAAEAYAEWLNINCVDDCQEKYIAIIAGAIETGMREVRRRDAEIASLAERYGTRCAAAIAREKLP